MKILFSTAGMHPRDCFSRWQQTIFERIVPVELTNLGERPFHGTLESADIGMLSVTQVTQSAILTVATPETIRRHQKHDTLTVSIVLDGVVTSSQDDREAIQGVGEIVVLDRRPTIMSTKANSRSVILEVPRLKLEGILGSAKAYSTLTIGSGLASTSLVTTFFDELIRTHHRLPSDTASRMGSIGIDLLVASIAERLAREVSKSLHGTIQMQRAKAYVEANLGDPRLDPAQVAAAVGVSVRRLQELFHEHGQYIADWIWRRRLETAASRLSDRGFNHLSLGTMAYDCGFTSQPHFSRRFKAHFGVTPSEYRHASGLQAL